MPSAIGVSPWPPHPDRPRSRGVYDTTYAEACRSLAAYLRARKLTRRPEQHAELLLSATTGGPVIRHLFGVDDPCADLPDDEYAVP